MKEWKSFRESRASHTPLYPFFKHTICTCLCTFPVLSLSSRETCNLWIISMMFVCCFFIHFGFCFYSVPRHVTTKKYYQQKEREKKTFEQALVFLFVSKSTCMKSKASLLRAFCCTYTKLLFPFSSESFCLSLEISFVCIMNWTLFALERFVVRNGFEMILRETNVG